MPNRILKESICTSDSIDNLSWFEEVLFYRLLVSCDDFGRFDGRAAIIKNRLFPLKENLTLKAVSGAVNALANNGMVTLYEFEGKPYICLPTWNEHQNIRAKKSKYPAPEDSLITSASICKQMQADVPVIQSNPIQSESESNTKEDAHTYGQYGWVKLTDRQHDTLIADLGKAEFDRCVAYVDESAQGTSNKNKWKDWNLIIRRCHREKWGVKQSNSKYMTAAEYDAKPKQHRSDLDLIEKKFGGANG